MYDKKIVSHHYFKPCFYDTTLYFEGIDFKFFLIFNVMRKLRNLIFVSFKLHDRSDLVIAVIL